VSSDLVTQECPLFSLTPIPDTAPPVLLEQDDLSSSTTYQGVGSVSGFFEDYGVTYIKVYNSTKPIYYHIVVSNDQATVP
jgi:hypothetical protein